MVEESQNTKFRHYKFINQDFNSVLDKCKGEIAFVFRENKGELR